MLLANEVQLKHRVDVAGFQTQHVRRYLLKVGPPGEKKSHDLSLVVHA